MADDVDAVGSSPGPAGAVPQAASRGAATTQGRTIQGRLPPIAWERWSFGGFRSDTRIAARCQYTARAEPRSRQEPQPHVDSATRAARAGQREEGGPQVAAEAAAAQGEDIAVQAVVHDVAGHARGDPQPRRRAARGERPRTHEEQR